MKVKVLNFMKRIHRFQSTTFFTLVLVACALGGQAQTTALTYQGRFFDGPNPALYIF
jgi:hypothetical protein